MTRFDFRWYGPSDAITLDHIRAIPPVTEVVTSLYHIPAGELWPEEELAELTRQIEAAGLHFTVVEGLPVHEDIKLGLPGRDKYIARNVALDGPQSFHESGHISASGRIDMAALFRILRETGFHGVIRPDHGRMVWGEQGRPGYGLYDRAMGVCYLNGLWEATCKLL